MHRFRRPAAHLIRSVPGASRCHSSNLVKPDSHISRMIKDTTQAEGTAANVLSKQIRKYSVSPYFVRTAASNYSTKASEGTQKKDTRQDLSTVEDPFDPLTYHIPEKPVTFVEGASYSFVILAGLGVAAFAAYAVFKELIFQPKEYTVFNKALRRIQDDSDVKLRLGSPITGYGSESRNRAARQRIPCNKWIDENGIEHVKVQFYVRGPRGVGTVEAEMFKDGSEWKYVHLVVQIGSPQRAQLILESYVPSYAT